MVGEKAEDKAVGRTKDGRRINDENMAQLARLAIRPLRIAFDDIKLKDVYCNAVRTAYRHGIKEISNYILFNYMDRPEDLYERLRINIEILAMPREMIIHRYYYRDNGTTARWRDLYQALTEEQKDRLMQMVSYTVGELQSMPCPDEFKEILPFYLLKYNGKEPQIESVGKQMSLLEDGDTFDDEQ